ncbi:unnamed protein product [Dovyalis caffra]|uniref:Uncharacterized protein n=1 Tax=Dovyalis caffra TaxID=77055 RepID=A0AAV1R411_9ROSI|nr:unnamed protein product [Dovyalis caffra]
MHHGTLSSMKHHRGGHHNRRIRAVITLFTALAKRYTPNKELLKIFNKKDLEKKLGHNRSSEDPPGSENFFYANAALAEEKKVVEPSTYKEASQSVE